MNDPLASKPQAPQPSYESIWKTLSQVDISQGVEKRGSFDYLNWMVAWYLLMQHYPQARYTFADPVKGYADTVTVECTVKIGPCERSMWLPVMDNRNSAIQQPDERHVSDTKMRCLVKCLAMFGLGWDLYSKMERPAEPPSSEVVERVLAELEDDARGGIRHLQSIWANYSEPIRTTILNDYADEWAHIKDMAEAES